MFGMGRVHGFDRKSYYDRTLSILNNRFSISSKISAFPSTSPESYFSRLAEMGWIDGIHPDENALFAALIYCADRSRALNCYDEEARRLYELSLSYLGEIECSGTMNWRRADLFEQFSQKTCDFLEGLPATQPQANPH